MAGTRLHGYAAIEYAEAHGRTLGKYADPTEDGREGLTVEQARRVAREDPTLVYVDAKAMGPNHRHRAVARRTLTRAFGGCVNPYGCEPGAHGNITDHEFCACGAERRVNINGRWQENGPWTMPD